MALPDYFNHYDKRVTNYSLNELNNFLKWCSELLGHEPTIVGGWAVYGFAPGHLGSRDIDVVFANNKLVHEVMNKYYFYNDFKEEGDLEKSFAKTVDVNGKPEKIVFDVSSYERINRLKENPAIQVPWNLIETYKKRQSLNGLKMWTPSLELLLGYKVKALRDRRFDLSRLGPEVQQSQRAHLESKIWKDEQDIKALLNTGQANQKQVNEILEKTGFTELYKKALKEF